MCNATEKINQWVKLALENRNFTNYKVEIEGTAANGDGFLSNITFVKVKNLDSKSKIKYLYLVIKSSKDSTLLKSLFPLQDCFDKEIYIYNSVKSEFEKLEKNCGADHMLDFLPFMYTSLNTDSNQLVILENLSVKNFKLWNRLMPMTFEHISLCLEAYANWHSFSMALRKKNLKKFQKLIQENNINIQSNFVQKLKILDMHCEVYETNCLKALGDDLKNFENYLKFTKDEIKFALIDIFFEDLEEHVILHGDGWNNNFMFRTEDGDERKPVEVKVLDWQCSGVGSPVLDISLLIYCCSNTKTSNNIKQFLEIYYNFLTKALEKLGLTANDVFCFNKLVQHWKKYSRFGLIFGNYLLKYQYFDAREAPDFSQMVENGTNFSKSLTEFFRKETVNEEIYIEKVRSNLLHYIKNVTL